MELFPSLVSVADKASGTEDDANTPLEEIESLCMQCGEQGTTRMLLTSIPFFQQIIVMSFRCDHCGTTNNEVQSASASRDEGTVYTARILTRKDLDRQIVRTSYCAINIPEFELTLPANRSQFTTVEGLIRGVVSDLSGDQPLRRIHDETAYTKIESLIDKLNGVLGDDQGASDALVPAFTIVLDDPSGNSFIEFVGSMADPNWSLKTYTRDPQQDIDLGISIPNESSISPSPGESAEAQLTDDTHGEIYVFPGSCPSCSHDLNTLMKKVTIPHFKDVFIMSTNCESCGYRDNEVKSGSAISDKGKRITLKVEGPEDLSRDILKSETSGFKIPEIDLELRAGTLGGRFTTVEGVLEQVYEQLSEKIFTTGDSSTTGKEDQLAFEKFLTKLKEVKQGERPFTLILDDPLANSYIQNLYAPDPDPNIEIVLYERTHQQNEDLGLNDMKVEGYVNDAKTSLVNHDE